MSHLACLSICSVDVIFTDFFIEKQISSLGEVTVKWFEGIQYGLPMCVLGAFFGPLRLGPKHTAKYLHLTLPWVVRTARQSRLLMNVYFEKHWHKPLAEFRRELNILEAPPKI